MDVKVEIRVMCLQAEEDQILPANYKELVERQEQILPQSPKKELTLPTP